MVKASRHSAVRNRAAAQASVTRMQEYGPCQNIRGHNPASASGLRATATYVPYRTYRQSKQANTAGIRDTMAISLTEWVFLRFSRDFFCVICLQDHSKFWQETVHVCEQSRF